MEEEAIRADSGALVISQISLDIRVPSSKVDSTLSAAHRDRVRADKWSHATETETDPGG